ncbi:MAG: 1,4-dihydroxy-2-naphthoyl-CoA hydrolase [Ignavibacteriaceae bacterium]|nr:1,4-dihydroxy-2-naphthoyl-CoA hydrolase [Ignavibacteriaceae bacterium]
MTNAASSVQYFHESRQLVRFEDCDPAGIIFFANYFRYAQGAIAEYFNETGEFSQFYNGAELVYPVISTGADFKKMVRLGDMLQIFITVSQMKESSFEFLFEFFHEGNKTAELKIAHVCISKKTGTKQKLPDFLKKLGSGR